MTPYYDEDGITIYHGDCRELLPNLPKADACVTDPPYGIGDKWATSPMKAPNGTSRLWGKGETWDSMPPDPETMRLVLDAGRQVIVWGGNYFGLPTSRGWLVWDKDQTFSGAEAELAWTNLPIPVRVFKLSRIDAFTNQRESAKQHPTEKPIHLMRWSLGFAPGSTVIDPFMGSGTTLRAAKDLGRRATGIEIEEKYCEIAVQRLAQGVLSFDSE